jgi:hypothetical protein
MLFEDSSARELALRAIDKGELHKQLSFWIVEIQNLESVEDVTAIYKVLEERYFRDEIDDQETFEALRDEVFQRTRQLFNKRDEDKLIIMRSYSLS